jgi:Asp-tRNA(Asn)/Glu-tRNA(Gln) amidotransferase A subunit family amidase
MDQEIKIEDAIGVLQDAGAEVEQSEVDKRFRCYKVDYYGEISVVGEVDAINWAMKIKNES